MVVEPLPDGRRSGEFSSAWSMFDEATDATRAMASAWNELVGSELFRSSIYVDDDGMGCLDVLVDEYEEHRLESLERAAGQFVDALLGCARAAVLAAEHCVSRPLRSGPYRLDGGAG